MTDREKAAGIRYGGEELDLFSEAVRWKAYWAERIRPLLGVVVLEVGAGIGNNTVLLCGEHQRRWLCIEPDAGLLKRLFHRIESQPKWSAVEARLGTLECVGPEELFDSILYIDVLEHIRDDKAELQRAGMLLRSKGLLIVLAPAHEWLYSPFDEAIGHYRRYSSKTLSAAGPEGLVLKDLYCLDSVGLAASLGNRLFLRRRVPSPAHIAFWDQWLIPLSVRVDPLFRYRIGKTIVGIWEKQ